MFASRFAMQSNPKNWIRNNSMQGMAAGSPGTLPTNWSITGTETALTRTISDPVTENGVECIDVRFNGTTNGTGKNFFFEGIQTAALAGLVWSHSFFVKLVAGALTNITAIDVRVWEYNAASSAIQTSFTTFVPTSTLNRVSHTRTLTDATTVVVRPSINFSFNNAAAVDATIRIGWPALELRHARSLYVARTTGLAARGPRFSGALP